jgi:GntR family transcriptional regulator
MINRNNPIPLYYQLMQELRQMIETGELKPGDTIPTESELMERYDLSRATVRQAVLHLAQEGYVRRLKARGTFVNTPPEKPQFIGTLKGFAEEMKQKGLSFATKVLEKKVIPSPLHVAEKLHIPSSDPVFYLKRLRFIQNEPVLIAESHLPWKLCRGIEDEDFEVRSLYEVLKKKYDIALSSGRREFEPVLPCSDEEIRLLKITSRTPILGVESVVYSRNNIPVEYVEIKMKGKFIVDLLQV